MGMFFKIEIGNSINVLRQCDEGSTQKLFAVVICVCKIALRALYILLVVTQSKLILHFLYNINDSI